MQKAYNEDVKRNHRSADESRQSVRDSRKRANWIATNSPPTHGRDELDLWFGSVINGYGPSWWFNRPEEKNGNNICFGKTGCEKARLYLRQHRDDVEGARVIAATYCLDNYDECVMNSRVARLGEDLLQVAALVAAAGVGRTSSTSSATEVAPVPEVGSLVVTASNPSVSELSAAKLMASRGNNVVLRGPLGTRAGGLTSDLLVNGVNWDVYTPRTGNVNRIVSQVASKGSQVHGGGVIIDLSQTTVTADQLANIEARVAGTGARVGTIVVMP